MKLPHVEVSGARLPKVRLTSADNSHGEQQHSLKGMHLTDEDVVNMIYHGHVHALYRSWEIHQCHEIWQLSHEGKFMCLG